MVTVQWWVIPALIFAGCGMARIVTAIFVAAYFSRETEPAPTAEQQPQPVIATGMNAYLGPIVEPEPAHIDREWVPWNTGWAGEHTTSLPVLEAAPALQALEAQPAARERFAPNLLEHLARQEVAKTKVTATYKDYKRIEFEVTAA